jgi:hypothetical protein
MLIICHHRCWSKVLVNTEEVPLICMLSFFFRASILSLESTLLSSVRDSDPNPQVFGP